MTELFYLPPDRSSGEIVSFSRQESKHITKSCRKGEGEEIQVTDGDGTMMTVRITRAGKKVEGEVLERHRVLSEPVTIDLGVGMSKRERMSWLVEKGTEVGMTSLTPLITLWSSKQRNRDEWEGHTARWKRVAISALKQSHRCYLPEIHFPETLERFLEKRRAGHYDLGIVLDRGKGNVPLLDLIHKGMKRFLILVGPEGGFCEPEISMITGEGFMKTRLISRRLRFETAGIAAIVIFAALVDREKP